jgi:hypothetical protein
VTKRRVSTPVVLAASSAMLAVGLIGFFYAGAIDVPRAPEGDLPDNYVALSIDDRTPERVAESFLDAWRRRAWDQAASIAVGEARESVLTKQAEDAEVDPVDRVMARDVWERLAGAPLEVEFSRSDVVEGGGLQLHGVASYDFMNEPYRREMTWVVRPEGDLWRVEHMEAGDVLTEIPELLRGVDDL